MILEQVLAPRHEAYQPSELRLLPLAHRLEDRGVELAGRLRPLRGGQQLGNVRRRASPSTRAQAGRVEREQGHCPLELAQKIRILLAPWGQLRRGKVERFVCPSVPDVLD